MAEAARLHDLLQLPREERARYARALIESLDTSTDDGCEEGWIDELETRALNARNHPEALKAWPEVRKRLRERLQNT